ncbi:hypothetical protein HDU91_000915 [Kappamyces sp. JEL0680]|nr:hypothetical protein HDU91_000915 [Kappamyces sp. JEL0680]
MRSQLLDPVNHGLWERAANTAIRLDPSYDPHFVSTFEHFGLFHAIQMNNVWAVACILKANHRKRLLDFRLDLYGYTPLMVAVSMNSMGSAMLLLLHHASVHDRDDLNFTALHKAAYTGNPAMVLALIEFGSDVNAISLDGLTPLHLACKLGHYEAARILLKHGADPRKKSVPDLHTCLHTAAMSKTWNNARLVQLLLDYNPTMVLERDIDQRTPLHLAVLHENSIGSVQALLTIPCIQVDAQDRDGNTALHYGLDHDLPEICKRLVRQGADINLRNTMGQRPIDNVSDENLPYYDMRSILLGREEMSLSMMGLLTSVLGFAAWQLFKN